MPSAADVLLSELCWMLAEYRTVVLCCCCALQELLVPVPTQLFQGSLLLGSITRLALGPEALARADVLISPLVIAGGLAYLHVCIKHTVFS
jgi:hypothetical protein